MLGAAHASYVMLSVIQLQCITWMKILCNYGAAILHDLVLAPCKLAKYNFKGWGLTRAVREAPLQPLDLVLQAIPLRKASTAASAFPRLQAPHELQQKSHDCVLSRLHGRACVQFRMICHL